MRKGTIYQYELKRLLFSKEYMLLLFATLIFCASLLRGVVLFGANYTAPFSQWTFCTYITSVLPILLILLLALSARQFTSSERGAAAIIRAVPMPASTFQLLRYSAIASAFLIVAALPVIACLVFYRVVFDYTDIRPLFLSSLLLLLPPAILLFSTAMLIGNRGSAAVYILLAAILIFSVFQISLPGYIDIIGTSVTLPLYTGDLDFAFSFAFIAGRISFVMLGTAFLILSLRPVQRKEA